MDIKLYTYNILETGTVTVSGTPDTGFPESRLYDRSTSLYWKDTITEAKEFVIDQGVTGNKSVDFLAIDKHNFNGIDIQWQWSNDNFATDINDAVTDWTQGDNLQIIKTLDTALTKRYWRVTLSNIANPKCGEIFMGCSNTFDVIADPPPILKYTDNILWNKTIGGIERSTKFGDKRRIREYTFLLNSTNLTLFRSSMDDIDNYSKPFYIKDTNDTYWMCRFTDIPIENPNDINTLTRIDLYLIEML